MTAARTGLAYYSGEDMLNLPLLAMGAVGVVSVNSGSGPVPKNACMTVPAVCGFQAASTRGEDQ